MKKLTKNNQLESNLELRYVYALADKCPIYCMNIAAYLRKSSLSSPNTFLTLKAGVDDLFAYIQKKNNVITIEDVEIYLAWRIWNVKRQSPNKLIFNNLCRDKARLLCWGGMTALHKSASRILTVKKQLTETIKNCKDETLIETLEEIKASVYIHTEIAVTFYNKVLQDYKNCLKEIDTNISNHQKLGGSEDV